MWQLWSWPGGCSVKEMAVACFCHEVAVSSDGNGRWHSVYEGVEWRLGRNCSSIGSPLRPSADCWRQLGSGDTRPFPTCSSSSPSPQSHRGCREPSHKFCWLRARSVAFMDGLGPANSFPHPVCQVLSTLFCCQLPAKAPLLPRAHKDLHQPVASPIPTVSCGMSLLVSVENPGKDLKGYRIRSSLPAP